MKRAIPRCLQVIAASGLPWMAACAAEQSVDSERVSANDKASDATTRREGEQQGDGGSAARTDAATGSADEESDGATTNSGGPSDAEREAGDSERPGRGGDDAGRGDSEGSSERSDAGGEDAASSPDGGEQDEAPVCDQPDAADIMASSVGGGRGTPIAETDHFRIYATGSADGETTAKHLEAAYSCFVEDGCWRSAGLSITSDSDQHYKLNVYGVGSLGAAAGVMRYDARAGLSYLEVLNRSLPQPQVTVHEFGHSLTLAAAGWVDQTRTGAWWETVANFVADAYLTSSDCEGARKRFGIEEGRTIIDLPKVIGQSYRVIVDDQNYYQAWPFFTYLTNNPDNYPGLGRTILPTLFREHARNNETPLHVLERVAAPIKVQAILGRYWARMAYLDIEHPQAQALFLSTRSRLDFSNLDAAGDQTYRVKASRRPRYGGANIIPLRLTGDGGLDVKVTNAGNGLSESNFTATLAIRSERGAVRYVELAGGAGRAMVASGEEASLVVVNTPDELYQFDAFQSRAPEQTGLNYEVKIVGAAPAN